MLNPDGSYRFHNTLLSIFLIFGHETELLLLRHVQIPTKTNTVHLVGTNTHLQKQRNNSRVEYSLYDLGENSRSSSVVRSQHWCV